MAARGSTAGWLCLLAYFFWPANLILSFCNLAILYISYTLCVNLTLRYCTMILVPLVLLVLWYRMMTPLICFSKQMHHLSIQTLNGAVYMRKVLLAFLLIIDYLIDITRYLYENLIARHKACCLLYSPC